MAQGKPAEAEAEYRAALKLKPDYAEAHCNLGPLLRRAGRYAEALEEFRRGHELGSRQPGWRYPSAQWVREAERLAALDARLPAVLKGDDHPADAAEGLTFAQICYDSQAPRRRGPALRRGAPGRPQAGRRSPDPAPLQRRLRRRAGRLRSGEGRSSAR